MPLPYRDRVAAFYRHYAPDKPASHVDYLMAKYAGHEDALIAVLEEKYGPEPMDAAPRTHTERVSATVPDMSPTQAAALLQQYSGAEDSLHHELVGLYGTEPHKRVDASGRAQRNRASDGGAHAAASALPDDALEERQRRFDRDMAALEREDRRRVESETLHAVADARMQVQRQEVEMQQLRMALSASQAQAAANADEYDRAIRQVAQQLTQAKLQLLALQAEADPSVVPAADLQDVVSATTQVDHQLEQAVHYCRCLADVLRRHLKLYPLSPMHATLRQLDPALCARLEQ